ncbi:Tetratricopeptide repeat protein 36 [Oryzias melastigma]|uniref:Tetratricopeptide repeat protein 36 n=2 Tax=Oryzias melastigma TaxID=30732 RepID=A0A834CGQ8_ORYME|nr:Tetratricopeptide repeat protein 36 [Oryzias melastigma]
MPPRDFWLSAMPRTAEITYVKAAEVDPQRRERRRIFILLHIPTTMASANDRAVLQAIFNPTSPFGDVPGINQEEELFDDDSGFDAELLKRVKELEMRGVSAAEAGDLQGALQLFSQAVHILPERASAYNNRAQALRLQGDTTGALQDLDRAIVLSGGGGRTGCQALVQRGLLRRLGCQTDEARADFEKAASLGSEFARQQAVLLNPYAALCNKMLSEVINKLRNPNMSEAQ